MELSPPQLSIVIPVRNREDEIARAVTSTLASARAALPDEHFELIVVDNGSTDASPRLAAEAGARVIGETPPSRTRARNRGAREARAPWVAFIDSDCEVDPQWAAALIAFIRALSPESTVAAIAGAIRDAPATTPVTAYLRERRWFDQEKYLARLPGVPFAPRFALTANLAVRRDVFLQLGGLDPILKHAVEDADFCLRLADAGHELAYASNAAVTHHHRATSFGLWRQSFDWGAGQAELFAKWQHRWPRRAWVEPRHWIWAAKGLLKSPWRLATGSTPFLRHEPWLDFIANSGIAWGRLSTGARKRKLVI